VMTTRSGKALTRLTLPQDQLFEAASLRTTPIR